MSRGNEQPARPPAVMAPITASSQSKSKLKTFQYEQKLVQTNAKVDESDKENIRPIREGAGSDMDPPAQLLSQRSIPKDIRECPQTPLGKLPLSQLLASGEDPRQNLNLTPIERVLWENSPLNSGRLNPGHVQRRRKRAHSSSPASSSQNEASAYFAKEKRSADIQVLQKALKTPRADPSDDLWSRYSLNTGSVEHRSPTAPTGLELAHLLHSSSPQTQVSHVQKESGGLRRALSCIEWPTSAAKRRKLFHGNSQKSLITELSNVKGGVEGSKISRVSLLINKVHENLAKPIILQQGDYSSDPGGSSPVEDRGDIPSSPKGDDSSLRKEDEQAIDNVANVLSQTAVTPPKHTAQSLVLSEADNATPGKAASSDFDDDDLDIEMMESLDTSVGSVPLVSRETYSERPLQPDHQNDYATSVMNPEKESRPPEQDHGQQNDPAATKGKSPSSNDNSSSKTSLSPAKKRPPNCDEFDDDSSEVFAADLEDVCAKYDSQAQLDVLQRPNSQNTVNVSEAQSKALSGVRQNAAPDGMGMLSEDDDFGSDSDFERIAVECAEATQKKQVSQPQSSVRTSAYDTCM